MSKREKKEPEKKEVKPRVHNQLEGFEISVDQFGEIKSNMNIEKINRFLNEHVEDKKLLDRDDYNKIKKPAKKKPK